ncbi:MAG: ion transporter [Acidobacteriota bacterium]
MPSESRPEDAAPWRERLYRVIFEHETTTGKAFDVALMWAILLSVLAVVLESMKPVRAAIGPELRVLEWFFTILFTIEYLLRLLCTRSPLRYARSFFGIVDLLAILPTYLSLVFVGSQTLIVIRALRLLRVFRVLKLGRFVGAERMLGAALRASLQKITVFLGAVLALVLIIGSLMYLIEGEANGYDSIPRGMYWAIVTLTTVGFGDITPQTVLGQLLASTVMMLGYAIIAVPTGIVTVELSQVRRQAESPRCVDCGRGDHASDARFCKHCGCAL